MHHTIYLFFFAFILFYPGSIFAQHTTRARCGTSERLRALSTPPINGKVTMDVSRPELHTSILSPSKHFRIHFDTIGINQPALVNANGDSIGGTTIAFVDSVARIFDSVWQVEISTFGFPSIAPDHGIGGGDEYDIYIVNLGAGEYGFTQPEGAIPGSQAVSPSILQSFIEIDNDYGRGYPTMGLSGLKVTAAHELFHAIQLSRYGSWNIEEWYFYELSAEAMEPTVFPEIKTYIDDISIYFNNIETSSLYTPYTDYRHGYDRAIWGIFLMKRYGVNLMREIWESVAMVRPVPAMKSALETRGTSLGKEFSEFCYWNYFTGSRADSSRYYYTDAKLFPMINIREKRDLSSTSVQFQYRCKGFSAYYFQVSKEANTAAYIVANVNMDDAPPSGSGTNVYDFSLTVSSSPIDGGTNLGWWSKLTVADPSNWKIMSTSSPGILKSTPLACFPNPYHPEKSDLNFYTNRTSPNQTEQMLTVYSTAMQVKYSGVVQLQKIFGDDCAVWNGKDNQGRVLASGIYLYVLSNGVSIAKGKFAVIR